MRRMAGQPGLWFPGMSAHYTAAIAVNGQGTVAKIKAIAVKSSMTNSTVTSGMFTIDNTPSPAKWGTAIWGTDKWNP